MEIGTIKVITFRTTREDHPYFESLAGLLQGYSSGHIALRLNFNNKELYDQYIRGNNRIPSHISIDPKTGCEEYHVYVSFWSDGIQSSWRSGSVLQRYKYDCEQSAHNSPINYAEKFLEHLQPIEKISASALPIAKSMFATKIHMPPSIILHTTRLSNAFQHDSSRVVKAAELYVKFYKAWRIALVLEQNTQFLYANDLDKHAKCMQYVKLTHLRMRVAEKVLQKTMFPDQNMNEDEFILAIEPFISYGYSERDSISLPLIHKSQTAGLELEPMLIYIKNIADHPEDFPYNVFTTNCAKTSFNILCQGLKDTAHAQLLESFVLPNYIQCTGLTITPNVILLLAEKLEHLIHKINSSQTTIVPFVRQNGNNKFITEPKTAMMSFSKQDDDSYDELPSTSISIFAKALENLMQRSY